MNFIDKLRDELNERIAQRQTLKSEIDAITDAVAAEDRSDLTPDETAKFAELRAKIAVLDTEDRDSADFDKSIAAARARYEDLVALDQRQYEAAKAPGTVARVVSEERTYHPGNAGERSFFADAYQARQGDPRAAERIARHSAEMAESRDAGTGAFGALVVPQYLVDLYAPTARAGRPVANAVRNLPLPDSGMTLNVPRITTATTTALQSSENSAVSETDIDETTLAVSVRTFAGQQDVSRQSLERGEMVDQVVFGDLIGSYAVTLDSHVISHGTDGILSTSGINAVTYTDASPTVAELIPKLADAIQQVNSNRFMPATAIFMHPRRWGWMTAAVDSSNRPLVVPAGNGPQNAVGVGQAAEYGQIVGNVLGLPVITDANIPVNLGAGTNEDRIIVAKADDLLLMEQASAPRELRFEQTTGGSLTTKLVVYGYAAFTAGRYPKSVSVISGTGLVTPTF